MTRDELHAAPYVGPRPYTAEDHALFFGRDAEVAEVVSLVIAHRSVLLYAVSGAGKSSLLRAGLIVALGDRGFEVLGPLRFQSPGGPPAEARNVYSFAAVRALGDLVNDGGQSLDPSRELSEVLAGLPRGEDAYGFRSPRVVIFDQFEEIFTAYQDRWQHREAFVRQVASALEHDDELRIVFSIREEYVAQFERYASLLPDGLRAKFHLERLRAPSALAAVTGPLALRDVYFEPGVAEALVHDLAEARIDMGVGPPLHVEGEFVEPVQLQVVCRTLWSRLSASVRHVTANDLATLGNVDDSLVEYYDDAIAAAAAGTSVAEHKLRDELERLLITSAGTRATVFAGERETATLPTAVLDKLADRHIIRAEWRAGGRWLELAHDRLIEPIRRANRAVRERHRQQRRRRLLLGGGLLSSGVAVGAWVLVSGATESTATKKATVPDVTAATSVFKAAQKITAAGLTLSHIQRSSPVVPGTVISQSPKPGTKVDTGSVVSLGVATGSCKVRVPDLTGVRVTRAQSVLKRAHLTLGQASPAADFSGKLVVSQTPASGRTVRNGWPVDVLLASNAPDITVPNSIRTFTTNKRGTRVTYDVSATDSQGDSLVPTCHPPSGEVFLSGTTTVSCAVTDSVGRRARESFTVVVVIPPP